MASYERRRLLFFTACLGVRWVVALMIGLLAFRLQHGPPSEWLVFSRALAIVFSGWVGLGFVYTASIRKSVGGFGGNVWWQNARYFHATMWIASAILLAWPKGTWWVRALPSVTDALTGILVGVKHFVFQR